MDVLIITPWNPKMGDVIGHELDLREDTTVCRTRGKGLQVIREITERYDLIICQLAPIGIEGASGWLGKLARLPADVRSKMVVFCLLSLGFDAIDSFGFRRYVLWSMITPVQMFVDECLEPA